MRVCMALLLGIATASCAVQHRVAVRGHALGKRLHVIRDHGSANVPAEYWRDGKGPTRRIRRVRIDQELKIQGGTVAIRDVVQACAPGPNATAAPTGCALLLMNDASFTVQRWKTYQSPSFSAVAAITLALLPVAGGIACGIACDGGAKERFEAAMGVTLGGYGLILLGTLVWMLIDCRGRWGSPGCRD